MSIVEIRLAPAQDRLIRAFIVAAQFVLADILPFQMAEMLLRRLSVRPRFFYVTLGQYCRRGVLIPSRSLRNEAATVLIVGHSLPAAHPGLVLH